MVTSDVDLYNGPDYEETVKVKLPRPRLTLAQKLGQKLDNLFEGVPVLENIDRWVKRALEERPGPK